MLLFRSSGVMRLKVLFLATTVAVAALRPGFGAAATLDFTGDRLDFSVSTLAATPQTPSVVGGQADLKAKLDSLQTSLQVGLQAGEKDDLGASFWAPLAGDAHSGRWNSRRIGLGATWTPTTAAKLELSANDQVREDLDDNPLWLDASNRHVRARNTNARVQATIAPLKALNLQFGGETSSGDLSTATIESGVATPSLLQNQSQQMFMTAQWAPLSRLKLESGGKVETMGVYWEAAGARAASYSYVEPRVGGSLAAWSGASLGFNAERAVAPLNTDQFAAFAQAVDGASMSLFRPSREWRYELALQQHLPADINLKATLTRAKVQSVTDLGPLGDVQAPMTIGSGDRSEIAADIAAPLKLFSLPALTMKLKGAWRTSEVVDPFTGAPRRLSGEAPYDAELTLSPITAMLGIHWGLSARARGSASFYQMSQITTQTASAGLGGFLAYSPGPLTIKLQLDNMLGGYRVERNVFYAGSREFDNVQNRSETRNADRVVRVQLTRAL